MASPLQSTVKTVGFGAFCYDVPFSLKIMQVSNSYLGSQHSWFAYILWSALDLQGARTGRGEGGGKDGGEETPWQWGLPREQEDARSLFQPNQFPTISSQGHSSFVHALLVPNLGWRGLLNKSGTCLK